MLSQENIKIFTKAPNFAVHFAGCFQFVLQDYTPEHVNIPRKRQIFRS